MNLELELQKKIEKYDMVIEVQDILKNELGKYIKSMVDGHEVGIMCAGKHTEHLLTDFQEEIHANCILDNNHKKIGTTYMGLPIYPVDKCVELDKVIISTYDYRDVVKKQLLQLGFAEENIIDIYDMLMQHGIYTRTEYYGIEDNVYVPFVYLNHCLKEECNDAYMQMLIKGYLAIRDVKSAQKYLHTYIQSNGVKCEEMKNLLRELEELISVIKEKMSKRKQRDIIWFWQDALCYDWVANMPFFSHEREKGLFFQNTFNSSVWTRSVYELIFHKRYEIDDKSYESCGKFNCEFVNALKEKGYDCVRVENLKKNEVCQMEEFDFSEKMLVSFDISTSQLYWTALNYVLNSDKPVFLLVHSVIEVHQPICSPNLLQYDVAWSNFQLRFEEECREKLFENVKITSLYLDGITEFVCDMLGKNAVKIFMSDHGSVLSKASRRWNKDANHFNFIVEGNQIEPRKCTGLFSLYNFEKVINYILKPNDENFADIFQKEIKLQAVDVYNRNTLEFFIKSDYAEYCVSFRGIQTLEDRYVLMKTGQEIYNVFPDDYTNYIDEPQYEERIRVLREKAGNHFIDTEDDEKFKDTYILYDFLKQKNMG